MMKLNITMVTGDNKVDAYNVIPRPVVTLYSPNITTHIQEHVLCKCP